MRKISISTLIACACFLLPASSLPAQTIYDSLYLQLKLATLPKSQLQANFDLGKAYFNVNVDSARKYFYAALTLANETGDTIHVAETKRNIGNCFWVEAGYDLALQYYFDALSAYTAVNNSWGEAISLNNIGEVYKKLGDLSLSLDYHFRAMELKLATPDAKPFMSYNNIGEVYLLLGTLDSAELYFQKIISESDPGEDLRILGYAYAGFGKLAIQQGEHAKAITSFQLALAARKEIGEPRNLQMSYHDIADAYINMGKFQSAGIYLDSASYVLKEIKAKDLEIEYHLKKFKVDSAVNQGKRAIYHLQRHYHLRDSIFNLEKTYLIQELNARYLNEKTKLELENLQIQSDLREAQLSEIYFTVAFISVGLMFLAVITFLLIRSRAILRKQQDELREKAHNLEYALKELKLTIEDNQSFSYSVSHDLKAPLRIISFYTATLQDEIQNAGCDMLLPTVNRIKENINRMEFIIRDILELSMVSQSEVKFQRVNLSNIAHEYLEEYQKNQPCRKVNIFIEENIEIMGDTGLLRIMMKNVLENAWKYSSKQDVTEISMSREGIKDENIVIKDNGTGFDMKYYDQIFKPFQRLHNENEFEGTGIGLSIVNRIIKKHNGQIRAESKIGEGTKIYINIPAGPIN